MTSRFIPIKILLFGLLLLISLEASAETRILFLGDSITAGLGVDKIQAYPYLVGEYLKNKGYKNIEIINAGISGSTSASAFSRLQWHSRLKPDLLILALGANDGMRGLSTMEMWNNLDRTIQYALKNRIKVILTGMEMPPNYGPEYTKKFREVFHNLAEKYQIGFMPFLLKDVGGIPKYNLSDGIHPNPTGHRIIARNLLPYILEYL